MAISGSSGMLMSVYIGCPSGGPQSKTNGSCALSVWGLQRACYFAGWDIERDLELRV